MPDSFESVKSEFISLMRRAKRVMPPAPPSLAGVTPAEARVLHMVFAARRDGQTARPGPLAARMRTTPSALSQILKDLDGKGLIVRARGQEDCRSVTLDLTAEGDRVARVVDDAYTDFARGLIEDVGIDEMRAFLGTFERIVDYCDAATKAKGGAA